MQTRRRVLGRRGHLGIVAVALASVLVSGCGFLGLDSTQPPEPRPIDAIGVIASSEWDQHQTFVIKFDDGRTYTLDGRAQVLQGGWFAVGDLLIAGSKPNLWFLPIHPAAPGASWPAGCYPIATNATEEADSVVLDSGVTLPKAADFDERSSYGTNRHFGGTICVDRSARVMRLF